MIKAQKHMNAKDAMTTRGGKVEIEKRKKQID